ncbi:MAG: ATP-binding cassette domain-containing protein [Planctomycetota bacterium]
MALIGLRDVSLRFDGPPILEGVQLQIEPGERIGLVGRNGAGKSSLLAVLAGRLAPDDGEITRGVGVRIAELPQLVPDLGRGTVIDAVRDALGIHAEDEEWRRDERVDRILRGLALDGSLDVTSLSAGLRRQVLLARALVSEPDLLILDEPTNHLDVDAILRLEDLLDRYAGAIVVVTHDRAFLRRRATRILDLDRGRLASYACDYETYLARREGELEAEAETRAQFDKKLAKEEAWIRRGVKARRKRNQGRVKALLEMREERRARRERTGAVKGAVQDAGRSGRLVLRAEGLGHDFDGRFVFRDLDLEILRGDRIGIIGPNGCGKTTLVRALLGELEPSRGTLRLGTKVEIARFDQLHAGLDENKTAMENVCADADTVVIGGVPRHIISYLEDFLFTPEQARGPVRKLSGGERNRLQLAAILARPCNLLVLDEPTNDLDVETLEILESWLADFPGTVLVVSHDRDFLDNVVTSTLVFEGEGRVVEYVGGYSDWVRQRPVAPAPAPRETTKPAAAPAASRAPKARKLGNKERAELAALPGLIETLEAEKEALGLRMAEPDFYRKPGPEIAAATERLAEIDREMERAFERWQELEGD